MSYLRRKVHTAKRLDGKWSYGELSVRRIVRTAKCTYGEMYVRQNVRTAKFTYGEMYVRQTVHTAKRRTAKWRTAKRRRVNRGSARPHVDFQKFTAGKRLEIFPFCKLHLVV